MSTSIKPTLSAREAAEIKSALLAAAGSGALTACSPVELAGALVEAFSLISALAAPASPTGE